MIEKRKSELLNSTEKPRAKSALFRNDPMMKSTTSVFSSLEKRKRSYADTRIHTQQSLGVMDRTNFSKYTPKLTLISDIEGKRGVAEKVALSVQAFNSLSALQKAKSVLYSK